MSTDLERFTVSELADALLDALREAAKDDPNEISYAIARAHAGAIVELFPLGTLHPSEFQADPKPPSAIVVHSRGLGYGPPTLCGEPGPVPEPSGEISCPSCIDIGADPRRLAERAAAVESICGGPPREWATGPGGATDEVFENSVRTAERVRTMNLILTWNVLIPPGSRVAFRPTLYGTETETTTRSAAWALGDGTPIVLLEGKPAGWRLDFVRALGPAPTEPAPAGAHERHAVGHRLLRVAHDLDVLALGGDAARGIHPAGCAADLRHCAEELGVEAELCWQCGRPWPAHSMAELGGCMDAAKAQVFAADGRERAATPRPGGGT